MKTEIFFYTGTGNSYWTARTIAKNIGGAELRPMRWKEGEAVSSSADAVGFIFPVHIWGLPRRVVAFADSFAAIPDKYYFAVAVNAGQVAGTLVQLKKLLAAKGMALNSGFNVVMPSNYIPWGGPGTKEFIDGRIEKAREKIAVISSAVAKREQLRVEKGPLWQNILFSKILYRLSFRHVPQMDKGFWVDERCNGCGICATVCPSGNIVIKDGKPAWQHRCEQCLACLQWCPKEALQLGKKTPRYQRYRHPEIKLHDMTALSKNQSAK